MTYKLSILATLFFVAGIALVLWLFLLVIRRIRQQSSLIGLSWKRMLVVKALVLASGIGLIVIAQFLFWVDANLKAFTPLDPSKPIAAISFRQPEESDPIMSLATRKSLSEQMIRTEISMRSETAVLEVEILRFPKSFSVLDIEDSYRISSVKFIEAQSDSQIDLAERRIQQDAESLWRFLDRISAILPAVRTAKIVSNPLQFEETAELEVYISASQIVLVD
jgi:hypothetical protein